MYMSKILLFSLISLINVSCGSSLTCDGCPRLEYIEIPLVSRSYPLIGAGQGIQFINDKIYLYGDSEIGIVQELELNLDPTGWTGALTYHGENLISHPTGIAYKDGYPTIMGQAGRFYIIDWGIFRKEGNLDNAIIKIVKDAISYKGARPEYVSIGDKWYIATAAYEIDGLSEIRLFDPDNFETAEHVDDSNVTMYRFPVSAFVQSLHWQASIGQIVLVQNIDYERGWKLTYLDLGKAIENWNGLYDAVTKTECFAYGSELEGYSVLPNERRLFLTPGGLFYDE